VEKITAILVDDEMMARENLRMLLNEFCPEIEVIGTAENIEQARALIKEKKPEAVFLDIRMPSNEEGLELLDDVKSNNFQVVFVTAFKEYAIKAFNANAIHYILKPIDIEELKLAVEKLIQYKKMFVADKNNIQTYHDSISNLSKNIHHTVTNKITISHLKGIKVVEDKTISHVEGEGNCTTIYFNDGTHFFDTRTLKVYEDMLNPDHFFRIHKKYIINLNYLTDYLHSDGYFAKLKNNISLPIARARVADFLKKIKSL